MTESMEKGEFKEWLESKDFVKSVGTTVHGFIVEDRNDARTFGGMLTGKGWAVDFQYDSLIHVIPLEEIEG